MEISWKLISLCLGLLLFQLCNGFPINLENSPADSHSQLLTGLVAVLLTVCSVVFLAGCLCCQRKNGFKEFRDSPVVASTASNLDHGHVNPIANGEFTIFTPLSPPHQNNNVFLANQQIITRTPADYSYGDVDVSDWFSPSENDFPRIKLKYIRELGRGWFGKVVEGAAQDIGNDKQQWAPVVVRILDASASSRERVIFLHDAAIYRCGSHPNLLALIGRCLDTIPLLLLQEYCSQGDLKNYLRLNKLKSENSVLSTEYPLIWCCQLTGALKFLHEKNVTHPDLATRNCQLTSNLTMKLGDYGLAVQKYPQDYYQGSPGVPVRWCAPESLTCTTTTIQPKKITKEANVWSLGVTMWEIFECGEQPYSKMTDDEVVSQVLGSPNVRLTRPSFTVLYTDYIYRLMESCWTSAESRPSVSQIDLMLADLLQVHKNTNSSWTESSVCSDDFDKRWELLKPNNMVKTDNHITSSMNTLEGDVEIQITKPMSSSLNNLHGSLDNLLVASEPQVESWLENDMFYVKGISDAIKDLDNTLAMENVSSCNSSPNLDTSKPVEFKLGPTPQSDQSTLSDSLNGSMPHRSSESETEEENWRKKIELGAYTEKVRLKSKSVADLMVLTHIDCSESEPETPLPSLDYRINYKNVRYPPKSNLENVSMTFGSEGNLLSVHDTFQDELRKLQEERRDSLLFVPDNHSQNVSVNESEPLVAKVSNVNQTDDSPSKRLMQELNSGTEIKPANQVYNVFNVTIDKYSPLHVNSAKLQEIINLKDAEEIISIEVDPNEDKHISKEETYRNSDRADIQSDLAKLEIIAIENVPQTVPDFSQSRQSSNLESEENVIVSNKDSSSKKSLPILENVHSGILDDNNEVLSSRLDKLDSSLLNAMNASVPTLVDIIQSRDDLMEYIVQNYNYDSLEDEEVQSEQKDAVIKQDSENANVISEEDILHKDKKCLDVVVNNVNNENNKQESVNILCDENMDDCQVHEKCNVKKVIDILENNVSSKEDQLVMKNCIKDMENVGDKNKQCDLPERVQNYCESNNPPLQTTVTLEEKLSSDIPNINGIIENSQIEKHETENGKPKVEFDLSSNQEAIMPKSLTISNVFTSTPFRKNNVPDLSLEDTYSSLNLFDVDPSKSEEALKFSSNFIPLENNENEKNLNYSLETWDNFLGKTLDSQSQDEMFDSFSSEPQSLLFLENGECGVLVDDLTETAATNKDDTVAINDSSEESTVKGNKTFIVDSKEESPESVDSKKDGTFTLDPKSPNADATFNVDNKNLAQQTSSADTEGTWEAGGGWFLHPQSSSEDMSGEMVVSKSSSDSSYVGFSMDDEIMAAIRNELLTKLPHAQGTSNENVKEEEEWDSCERNEVFLRYNVYNTPLSPIPEESFLEDCSGETTPRHDSDDYCSEYEEEEEEPEEINQPDTETASAHQSESPVRGPLHRHTPSQDSCCSNDTLFNLEELTCATVDQEAQTIKHTHDESAPNEEMIHTSKYSSCIQQGNDINNCDNINEKFKDNDLINCEAVELESNQKQSKKYLEDFIQSEKENSSVTVKVTEASEENSSDTPSSTTDRLPPFVMKQFVPPLPSPEDKPWKQLPASMLSYDKVIYNNVTDTKDPVSEIQDLSLSKCPIESQYENVPVIDDNKDRLYDSVNNSIYDDIENIKPNYKNILNVKASYENVPGIKTDYENIKPDYENIEDIKSVYENIDDVNDIYNEADYVNIVNFENSKNSAEFNNKVPAEESKEESYEEHDDLIINHNEDEDSELFGVLTDIRFNGPADSQFMSTSFSESNDNDEQDWDSGSDTRSSSSGEFIWKEGEHEESLKALRAAPQDVLDDIKPMEGIEEEELYSDSSVSSGSTSSDEGETPEFVPSAWDKYATPTKSALRSPEKTLERDDKKSKGVWFKKQKYHCVYEYPREPDSPVLQSQDLWKPQTDFSTFADWEFDADTYLPPPTDDNDILSLNNYTYQPNTSRGRNLYQLTNISEPSNSGTDDEFFISSSARPFDMISSLSSQFFPGHNHWTVENITPDSGMEDITPGSLIDDYPAMTAQQSNSVPSLRTLAADAANKTKKESSKGNDVLGGLRHTRNKLKLDLPPSPSAFTTGKMFTVEPNIEPVVLREKPTFSTFGKSRFLVQPVDTPPEGTTENKNVSFEALPYKPMRSQEILEVKLQTNDNSPDLLPYSSLKTHIMKEDFELDKSKSKVEFVRGEASLLDSADEDSGIESSTLERKLSNVV